MKMLSETNFNARNFSFLPLFQFPRNVIFLIFPVVLFLIILLAGCSKQQPEIIAKDFIVTKESHTLNSDDKFLDAYLNDNQSLDNLARTSHALSLTTALELLQVRAATARYHDFEKAKADSFVDIDVVVQNMGYHFMKSTTVDSKFEIRKPEILVYNKKLNGKFELMAVEYAVPINVTPDKAPEGFTGIDDVWERNTDFGLWLLHAWVWQFNPDGVFHDTNPLVQLH